MANPTAEELAGYVYDEPGTFTRTIVGADVASVAGNIIPTGKIFRVTGTLAITGIQLPYAGFSGALYLIPTGIFTFATGGTAGIAIALASTAVVGKVYVMIFHPTPAGGTGLWYPSY